jgi:hypothetical protein
VGSGRAGEKPHALNVAAHEHSEAVVFDFMRHPAPAGDLAAGLGRQGSQKSGKATRRNNMWGINTNGSGRVESDFASMKTKTYFAFASMFGTAPEIASPSTLPASMITPWQWLRIGRQSRAGPRIKSRCAKGRG